MKKPFILYFELNIWKLVLECQMTSVSYINNQGNIVPRPALIHGYSPLSSLASIQARSTSNSTNTNSSTNFPI